jgi:hypothetical protein
MASGPQDKAAEWNDGQTALGGNLNDTVRIGRCDVHARTG